VLLAPEIAHSEKLTNDKLSGRWGRVANVGWVVTARYRAGLLGCIQTFECRTIRRSNHCWSCQDYSCLASLLLVVSS
ncbi:hypothetical protein PF005_g33107, partial [Phytophthora fragariae]